MEPVSSLKPTSLVTLGRVVTSPVVASIKVVAESVFQPLRCIYYIAKAPLTFIAGCIQQGQSGPENLKKSIIKVVDAFIQFIITPLTAYRCTVDYVQYGSPFSQQRNKDVVLAAVGQDGRALWFASEELKNDREFMLAAIGQDGRGALWFASEELKNDREFMLAAVGQDGGALQFA